MKMEGYQVTLPHIYKKKGVTAKRSQKNRLTPEFEKGDKKNENIGILVGKHIETKNSF